ncbi:class I SAM-dependent methyltransferase [Marinivivus vitaminiproducens]|uniref:class I SAM-dependent methyltransferase n=1 Tax=Marinivivus vitaminiproducens TaxID=3035935 RepID=UPI00279E3D9B|nr:class I SAM-dependent methyltransferase [Geminicoccaceae bacterium SCSIO 64248]
MLYTQGAMSETVIPLKAIAKHVLPRESRIVLRKAYYFGTRHTCTVCGSRVRKYYPSGFDLPVLRELDVIGGEYRLDDTCPVCWSHCRTRLVRAYLEREVRLGSRPMSVLHFAPEAGIAEFVRAAPGVTYDPVDLDPSRYVQVPGTRRADVTAIDRPNDSYDLVICNHVLEHVPDDGLAMREILRVLKPGVGMAMLQVPLSARLDRTIEDPSVSDVAERERRFGQFDHIRLYGADYTDRLASAGFTVDVVDPPVAWGQAVVDELGLNPREQVIAGRKPATGADTPDL